MSKTVWEPLPREEVIKAVERKNPRRIPLFFAKWWGEGLGEQYGERLREFDRYSEDVNAIYLGTFDASKMNLSWGWQTNAAHDANCVIDDWAKLDEFIEKLPDPAKSKRFEEVASAAESIRKANRYLVAGWWGLFFEQPWGLRGMENLMTDYYLNGDKIHRLHSALCDFYCKSIEHAAKAMKPDGFWTSDDLGNQMQPMMRRETFDEFLKPYYTRVGQTLKKHNIHFWLHSCGNNTPLLDSLIDAGVQMFHPVQKHTMDEVAVAREYGERLGFWSGFDVQQILQTGTPDEVRAEVRHLIDTFDRPEGGMVMAAGNGIVSGTPFENIDAFLDEALTYGEQKRASR